MNTENANGEFSTNRRAYDFALMLKSCEKFGLLRTPREATENEEIKLEEE